MHGHDPADRVYPCPDPRCPLTWSSRERALECAEDHGDDDEPDAA